MKRMPCFSLFVFMLFLVLGVNFSCSESSDFVQNFDTLQIKTIRGTGTLVLTIKNDSFPKIKPQFVSISIYMQNGKPELIDSMVPVHSYTENIAETENIGLYSGYYSLNYCAVFDQNHSILYQSDWVNSKQFFKIENGKSTILSPELFPVKCDSFFMYAYTYSVEQNRIVPVQASVTLSHENKIIFNGTIDAEITSVRIPQLYNWFIIEVSKEGYAGWRDSFPRQNLSLYRRIYPYTAWLGNFK